MKIHDFGLWFCDWSSISNPKWSTTIPHSPGCRIYYDGKLLGLQDIDLNLYISITKSRIIKLRNNFPRHLKENNYEIGRILTIDDFEIIPNPNYKEIP